jgi:branched-chain amino acid transport system permease protein
MSFAQLSNVRLEYVVHGQGPERILFIHGFQASARIWEKVQKALPAERYTSVALNNRGAGRSDAPPDEADYGVSIFAADAFELAAKLEWERFTLVGHSLGGATAMQFALDHPQVLNGLVLLDPASPNGRALAGGDEELSSTIDALMAARREQQALGAGGDGIVARGASDDWLRLLANDMRAAPEQRLRGSLRSMFTLRLGDRLKTLAMPVLLAGGDADELIPVANMLETWALLPQGSGLHFWHGVGHSPNVDCPEALASLLERFVERTIPARSAAR